MARTLWEHDLQIFTQKYVLIKYQKSTISTRNVTIKTLDVFMSLIHMLIESRSRVQGGLQRTAAPERSVLHV